MRTEQEARHRVTRLLAEAGLAVEGARVSTAWQEADQKMQRIRALGTPTAVDVADYDAAFTAYYQVYDRAGVWGQ